MSQPLTLSVKRVLSILALAATTLTIGFLAAACQNTNTGSNTEGTNNTSPASSTTSTTNAQGLKIGSLLPATGDLGPIGQQMASAVPLLVETVNACGV